MARQKNLGVQLRRVTRRRKWTVSEIATSIGCSRVTVYHWLAGRKVSVPYRPYVERLIAKLEK